MSQFGMTIEPADGHTVLSITGELDLAVAPKLEACLNDLELGPGDTLVIDLSGLEFLDSSGLRILVMAHHRAEQEGFRFVLVRGTDPVARIFELTRMDQQLEIVASRDELAALEG
jgi:anti-sigma B factor antagonist